MGIWDEPTRRRGELVHRASAIGRLRVRTHGGALRHGREHTTATAGTCEYFTHLGSFHLVQLLCFFYIKITASRPFINILFYIMNIYQQSVRNHGISPEFVTKYNQCQSNFAFNNRSHNSRLHMPFSTFIAFCVSYSVLLLRGLACKL